MEILIIGSGAIGRGYLPWVFQGKSAKFTYIDNNKELIGQMRSQKHYTTYIVRGEKYEKMSVPVQGAFTAEEFIAREDLFEYAATFVSVGPRNVAALAPLVRRLKGPVVLCENDPQTVMQLRSMTGKDDIYFAIPDVITSNTAPQSLLQQDPLSIVSESGELFIDEKLVNLDGDFKKLGYDELILQQWTTKLFLHNTPHCIAAYLGALAGVSYVHESMAIKEIDRIVSGAMEEMLNALKARWDIEHSFLEWYAQKELSRFRCNLLFDPIARVAREPLRKLELDGRLIGAAQMCLSLGFIPENIMLGITAALLFDNPKDNDKHLAFMQKALSPTSFLTHVLGLRQGEALEVTLKAHLNKMISELKLISSAGGVS